jgi:hypothetical protein
VTVQVRRCINCRHYEPSPLRGKGWCRNPLLHKRTENFLVDGKALRCRTSFRDYWEPIPEAKPLMGDASVKKGGLSRRGTKPLEASIDLAFDGRHTVARHSDGGSTSRVSRRTARRSLSFGTVVLVGAVAAVIGWGTLALTLWREGGAHKAVASATPTVVTLAPGSGPTYPTPAPGAVELTRGSTALVSGTGGQGLKVRTAPDINAPVIRTLREGSAVTLKDGPEVRGGYRWWQIDDGQGLGWVVQDWLSPPPK